MSETNPQTCTPCKDLDVELLYLSYIQAAMSETTFQTCAPRKDSDATLLHLCYIQAAMSVNVPSDMFLP